MKPINSRNRTEECVGEQDSIGPGFGCCDQERHAGGTRGSLAGHFCNEKHGQARAKRYGHAESLTERSPFRTVPMQVLQICAPGMNTWIRPTRTAQAPAWDQANGMFSKHVISCAILKPRRSKVRVILHGVFAVRIFSGKRRLVGHPACRHGRSRTNFSLDSSDVPALLQSGSSTSEIRRPHPEFQARDFIRRRIRNPCEAFDIGPQAASTC